MEREREDEVFFAQLASKAERYDEVVESIKRVCELDANLSLDEGNLLAEGYHKIAKASLQSWRTIRLALKNEEEKDAGETEDLRRTREYCLKLEAELKAVCEDCITLIDTYLIPLPNPPEADVLYNIVYDLFLNLFGGFYRKGDQYRYLAETNTGDEMGKTAEQSKKAYESAKEVADAFLPATNTVRLLVEHKFSVLYYDICKDIETAYHMAKTAYGRATDDIVVLADENKSRVAVMEKLMDNINKWSEELANRGADPH